MSSKSQSQIFAEEGNNIMMIVRNTSSLPPFWNKSSEFLWTKPRSSALLPENNDSHKGSHRATNGRTHAGEIAEEKDCADYTIIHFNFFILSIIAVCICWIALDTAIPCPQFWDDCSHFNIHQGTSTRTVALIRVGLTILKLFVGSSEFVLRLSQWWL